MKIVGAIFGKQLQYSQIYGFFDQYELIFKIIIQT